MADNDDKRNEESAGGKKTLSLKGAPNLGGRPNLSRSSRNTVVVEKRTRFVPQGAPGLHGRPTPANGASARPHPSQPGAQQQRPASRAPISPRNSGALSATESDARVRALR
jgi:translation initiation factor IF-2